VIDYRLKHEPVSFSQGTFVTIQAAARQMQRRGIRGSVAITASMSGSIANKGQCQSTALPSKLCLFLLTVTHVSLSGLACLAYNTSKAALLQMCRSAAAEWGTYGIRVNVSFASPRRFDVCNPAKWD
jgi:NAD(P)-dependent dehydrogenase (short-subunit alcohol dehydrogenase family)